MEEKKVEKGQTWTKEELAKLGYRKDHGIGSCEIWALTKGCVFWLLRDSSTGIVKDIVADHL